MKKLYLMSIMMLEVFALPLLVGCSSEDDDVFDTTPIKMFAGDEKVISDAETITSSNGFIANADGNKVKAFHVGETELVVNGKYKIPVTVFPLHYLYDDPVCKSPLKKSIMLTALTVELR